MKQAIAFLLFNVFCVFNVIAQDYLCIPSSAAGFAYNASSKKWERSFFKIDNEKKILKKTQNGYEWRDFGSSSGSTCPDFNQFNYLHCKIFLGDLVLNRKTLRFIETYMSGYHDGVENNSNTPLMQIGTCTPL